MGLVLRIIAAVFARIKALGWLAGWAPAVWWVGEKIYDGDLKKDIYAAIAEEVSERSGLTLDANDPFSDASFSGAVSQKIGFPIRSLKDHQMIKEDLDSFAADLVSTRSGFVIRSVSDVDVLMVDLQRVALAVMTEQVGIPLGVIADDGFAIDAAAVKVRVLAWAKAQLLADVGASVNIEASDIAQMNIDWVVDYINRRAESGEVSAHGVSLVIADRLALGAVADYQKVALDMTKRQRRRASLRAAQAKFRRLHGDRQVYVPLGMVATVA